MFHFLIYNTDNLHPHVKQKESEASSHFTETPYVQKYMTRMFFLICHLKKWKGK